MVTSVSLLQQILKRNSSKEKAFILGQAFKSFSPQFIGCITWGLHQQNILVARRWHCTASWHQKGERRQEEATKEEL
jgi:hypothetical protein